jgi:predicted nuclease of restriction endonuclease-like (RecB) superfamily
MPRKPARPPAGVDYPDLLARVSAVLEQGRRSAARSVNAILAASYWQVGRHIVEHEQGGKRKAGYAEELFKQLAADLTARFGRGFSRSNLQSMRAFYLGWPICQTVSGKLQVRVRYELPADEAGDHKAQTVSALSPPGLSLDPSATLVDAFPLPWSHYVRLMAVRDDFARWFYEDEAIRGGWSVRQLDRQVSTLLFERTGAARNKTAVLARGRADDPADAITPAEAIRDPYLLEFLDLKDEYGETDLEEAIVRHLETFLLELGSGFTFIARQKRVRIGDTWYKIDLLLFHRALRCLVVIDLKLGAFTHADAGQMNLYLNYAREHLTEAGENDPVGLILCSDKDDAVVHYAMGGINARVFASTYKVALPDEATLRRELVVSKQALEDRAAVRGGHLPAGS